jgi:hypothetical protein
MMTDPLLAVNSILVVQLTSFILIPKPYTATRSAATAERFMATSIMSTVINIDELWHLPKPAPRQLGQH